jgi:hypothetical protein
MIGKTIKYVILGIAIVLGLYFGQKILDMFYENKKLHEDLINTQQKYEQLSETSAKLEIQYREEKELQKIIEEDWAEEKSKLEGKVKILAQATFSLQEKERLTNQSDVNENGKYSLNEIRFNDGPPLGYVLIYNDGRVASKLYDSEIQVNTIVTKDDKTGKYNIASKADYVLKEKPRNIDNNDWLDKKYALPITGGIATIDPVEEIRIAKARFYLFAPRIGGGVHFYIDNVVPYLGVSLAGIGVSKRDLSWKFLEFGVEYSKDTRIGLSFTPILYRPFPNILSNTYIGAGITWNEFRKKYFIGLNVGF